MLMSRVLPLIPPNLLPEGAATERGGLGPGGGGRGDAGEGGTGADGNTTGHSHLVQGVLGFYIYRKVPYTDNTDTYVGYT